jgi:hypothetical protein
MIGKLIGAVVLMGVAYFVVSSLPEVARYRKIRRM